MEKDIVSYLKSELQSRVDTNGGFCLNIGEGERVDATAWAVSALRLLEGESKQIVAGMNRLASQQFPDGRIVLSKDTPDVYWPTSIALIAWDRESSFRDQRKKAVEFLLSQSGTTVAEQPPYLEHNTSLRGWPWVEDTYSWVEPTSMVLMALASQGYVSHPRYLEGTALLLDRMLPEGGWNYGNKKVFDSRLRPLPDYTGMALCALRNEVEMKTLENSLEYLGTVYPKLTTPFSLSWVIRGLVAYGIKPTNGEERIIRCLKLQSRYGPYETSHLAQLTIALFELLDLGAG